MELSRKDFATEILIRLGELQEFIEHNTSEGLENLNTSLTESINHFGQSYQDIVNFEAKNEADKL